MKHNVDRYQRLSTGNVRCFISSVGHSGGVEWTGINFFISFIFLNFYCFLFIYFISIFNFWNGTQRKISWCWWILCECRFFYAITRAAVGSVTSDQPVAACVGLNFWSKRRKKCEEKIKLNFFKLIIKTEICHRYWLVRVSGWLGKLCWIDFVEN